MSTSQAIQAFNKIKPKLRATAVLVKIGEQFVVATKSEAKKAKWEIVC